jgi:hypothetical protein
MFVADFAMKWLPYKYRETMNEWFGKKGKIAVLFTLVDESA